MLFLRSAAAVPDTEAAVPRMRVRERDKAEDSAGKQAYENSQNSGYHQGNAAGPLAFFPDLLVFHTPLCPKATREFMRTFGMIFPRTRRVSQAEET